MEGAQLLNCGIPSIQNTQINSTELARCTLSVSCLTDLDHCVLCVHWVSVSLERMHRTLQASERFTPNFPIISLHILAFWRSQQATTVATFTLQSDLIIR